MDAPPQLQGINPGHVEHGSGTMKEGGGLTKILEEDLVMHVWWWFFEAEAEPFLVDGPLSFRAPGSVCLRGCFFSFLFVFVVCVSWAPLRLGRGLVCSQDHNRLGGARSSRHRPSTFQSASSPSNSMSKLFLQRRGGHGKESRWWVKVSVCGSFSSRHGEMVVGGIRTRSCWYVS